MRSLHQETLAVVLVLLLTVGRRYEVHVVFSASSSGIY